MKGQRISRMETDLPRFEGARNFRPPSVALRKLGDSFFRQACRSLFAKPAAALINPHLCDPSTKHILPLDKDRYLVKQSKERICARVAVQKVVRVGHQSSCLCRYIGPVPPGSMLSAIERRGASVLMTRTVKGQPCMETLPRNFQNKTSGGFNQSPFM